VFYFTEDFFRFFTECSKKHLTNIWHSAKNQISTSSITTPPLAGAQVLGGHIVTVTLDQIFRSTLYNLYLFVLPIYRSALPVSTQRHLNVRYISRRRRRSKCFYARRNHIEFLVPCLTEDCTQNLALILMKQSPTLHGELCS
jgi:hypothetical protein